MDRVVRGYSVDRQGGESSVDGQSGELEVSLWMARVVS